MPNRNWCERVRHELLRQGLPHSYVARLVEELSEHATDLFKEDRSMDAEHALEARLGNPQRLAEAAKSEFHHRTFAGRHPLLTFVAAPVFVVTATIVATIALMAAMAWGADLLSGGALAPSDQSDTPPTPFQLQLIYTANFVVRFVPFLLSAFIFVRLGQRSGREVWSLGACGIIALFASAFVSVISATSADGHGTWVLGFGWKPELHQLMQAILPSICGLWVLTRLAPRHMTVQQA